MGKERRFIAIDLGAESGRCIVTLLRDQKVEMHEVHRFETHSVRQGNELHWDISAIYESILSGLMKAGKSFGAAFDGIGVDTWGVDYVLLDDEGVILNHPYHYRDDRTHGMMRQAFKIVPKEKIYSLTGIQFAQFNTLFQLLAEKRSKPDSLRLAKTMMLIPDFLNYMLTGVKRAEFSIASTTALADPKTRDWSWEVIKAFGFPRSIFPLMVEPGTILGRLLPPVAKKAGLDLNIPVIAVTGHDTASAVVSVPASQVNWAYLSSGTWSLIGIEVGKPIVTSEAMNCNFTNEGGFERTTRLLKNIIGLWPLQESRRFWKEDSKDYSYSELAAKAAQNGYASSWVDLDDQTFLKNGNMPEMIVNHLRNTGQQQKSEIGFITRVILESLAFSYRNAIRELETVSGKRIDVLHAVGGGIQNDLLTQLTADAIGRPVIAGPVEGTAIGNVGVQAIAIGAVSNLQQWRDIVASSVDLKVYEPKDAAYFDEKEGRYNEVIVRKKHHSLNKMIVL